MASRQALVCGPHPLAATVARLMALHLHLHLHLLHLHLLRPQAVLLPRPRHQLRRQHPEHHRHHQVHRLQAMRTAARPLRLHVHQPPLQHRCSQPVGRHQRAHLMERQAQHLPLPVQHPRQCWYPPWHAPRLRDGRVIPPCVAALSSWAFVSARRPACVSLIEDPCGDCQAAAEGNAQIVDTVSGDGGAVFSPL